VILFPRRLPPTYVWTSGPTADWTHPAVTARFNIIDLTWSITLQFTPSTADYTLPRLTREKRFLKPMNPP